MEPLTKALGATATALRPRAFRLPPLLVGGAPLFAFYKKKNAQHGKEPAKPSQSRLHKQKKRDVVLVAGDMPGPPASCCSIDCKTEETQLLDDKAGVRRI